MADLIDLAIQLRGARFDVHVTDALVGQVPVEQGLELMAAVGANGVNAERELRHDVIHERD